MKDFRKKKLAIIIPCFNEQDSLEETITEIFESMSDLSSRLDIQVVVIDDHSDDDTYQVAKNFEDKRVSSLRLSRRSGSHIAIRSGLKLIDADAYAAMAADGQDNPEALVSMVDLWEQGKDIVWALRRKTIDYHPWHIRIPSTIFYSILKKLSTSSSKSVDLARADFFLLAKKVRDAVNNCGEQETSLFGLLVWMGFKQGSVEYDRRARRAGATSWSFGQRVQLALDWIISFSEAPLKIVFGTGTALFSLGAIWLFIAGIYSVFANGGSYWYLLLPIIILLGSIQLLAVGLIGTYIKKALEQSKKRPLFFIEENNIVMENSESSSSRDNQI